MGFQHIDLDVDDPPLDRDLQFPSQTVVVDNYTNQYLHLLGEYQDYIPPYTLRAIYQGKVSRIGRAKFEAPIGLTQAPVISGQSASLDFYAEALAPTTGTTLTPFAEQELIGTIAQGAVASVARSATVLIPPGTHAIGILICDSADFIAPAGGTPLSSIIGGVSGAFYVNQNLTWEAGLTFIPIASGVDTSATISLVAGTVIRAGAKAYILAIKDVEAVQTYGGVPFVHDLIIDQGHGYGPGLGSVGAWGSTKPPYDGQAQSSPAISTVANATLAAVAGVQWIVDAFSLSILNSAAGATPVTANIDDGTNSIWAEGLAVTAAAGTSDHANLTDLALVLPVNNQVRATSPAAPNIYSRASIGAYQY